MDELESYDPRYWERSEFLSFSSILSCACSDHEAGIKQETGDILLPPSPNWFFNNAIDTRSEDGLMVTAAFKSLTVFQVSQERALPKVVKVIPYANEKVLLVRLHPQASNKDYGHTVASISDSETVKLLNLHNGEIIGQHKEHNKQINGMAWGAVGDDDVLVTVGGGGRMVVWQAKHGVTKVHNLPHMNDLAAVEVNPKDPSQAIVAVQKAVVLVSLKNGKILTQFKGHEFDIYCIKWYMGSGSPLEPDLVENNSRAEALVPSSKEGSKNGSKSDNWRESAASSSEGGPYFASSDYGRNILLWDVTAKRYIVKTNVPHSGFKNKGKEKVQGKQHISLAWYDGNLYSSTIRGELLSWTVWPGGAKFKSLHHLHNRAIYNLVVVGDIAVTSGQDRFLHGFHLKKLNPTFQLPTLGTCATTLSFCPQDINRLAVGTFDNNIRLLNFGSPLPLQTQSISYNINGKVLSLAWHPAQEGRLLFGTATGQVGWTDALSGRVTTFAYHHQKSVYKVEWGLPVCPEKLGASEDWYAYSFGDREIVMRSASDPMADPFALQKLGSETNALPKDLTEFAFSPDYKYLAVGSQDGQVRVYLRSDLTLVVTLCVARKSIQHLLWQPPTQSHYSDVLAVGSSEKQIYIFEMEKYLQDGKVGTVVTQASRELSGHESRVVWLAWSPHEDGVLASASYDHTVQLWNANTGEPKVNYGGHISRVFRVEFSPDDPDLMYSFADENSVHTWRPSEQITKTPAESSAILKEHKPKKTKDSEKEEMISKAIDAISLESKPASSTTSSSTKSSTSSSSTISSKKAAFKSFFPKLHAVCSKKKSFWHLLILNLLERNVAERNASEDDGKVEEAEELEEEFEEEVCSKAANTEVNVPDIKTVSEQYACLLEKDTEMPDPEDIDYALNLYGKPHQLDVLLAAEIDAHEKKDNAVQAGFIHCWQGSLSDYIQKAAKQRKLNVFLVASAPQVSMQLWQFACEAYAEQLIDEGDIITGASYLVNASKVEDAVNVLLKHHHHREALAIAKSRLSYNEELLTKVVTAWASSAAYEGNFDLSALLQLSIGQLETAARSLSRKSDSGSLFVAAILYTGAKNEELATAMGLLALKEASVKHEHHRIEPFIEHLPHLKWYRAISTCHNACLKLLQQVNSDLETSEIYLLGDISLESETSKKIDSGPSEGEKEAETVTSPLIEKVSKEWSVLGITEDQYADLHETINQNFSMQQIPTTLKQLWFLVSVSVCKMLTSPSTEICDQHLVAALNHTLSWGKVDQLFHLTHSLLPKGSSDCSTLGKFYQEADSVTPAVSLLLHIYNYSEISLLHHYMESDEALSAIKTQSNNEVHCNGITNKEVIPEEATSKNLTSTGQRKSENSMKNSFYSPPQTWAGVIATVHHQIDYLNKGLKMPDMIDSNKVSLEPEKLLREITFKLKESKAVEDIEIERINQRLGEAPTED